MLRNSSDARGLLALAVAAALWVLGCLAPDRGKPTASLRSTPSTGCCAAPVRLLVLQDQTGSRGRTLTPVLGNDDLKSLLEMLFRCGGEMRIGEIGAASPTAFLAIRIEEPPEEVAEPSEWPANPFLRAEAQQGFQKARQGAVQARASWRAESQRRVEEFEAALAKRWEGATLADRTDIWSALERASLFLREPEAGFPKPMRRWLIAITDGEQTAPRPGRPLELDPAATLVVVNAGGHQGDLASLNPQRFESLSAAIRWVVEQSTREPNKEGTNDV